MEYPIYGRGQRHVCKTVIRKRNTAIATHGELLTQKIERITYQCPICNKIFQKESDLSSHVIKMRKQDDFHETLFQKQIDLIEFEDKDENLGERKENTSNHKVSSDSIEWSKYHTKHEYFTLNERYYLKKKKPPKDD
jgi:uncharacterized C2H2 Zn-finger protein